MRNKKRSWATFSLIITILILSQAFCFSPSKGEEIEPAFIIVAKAIEGLRAEYLYDLKEDLAAIGIYVDVIIQSQSDFANDLIINFDFDMFYMGFIVPQTDPDMRGAYDGISNLYGYDTSIDYEAAYGTGLNVWYMNQGVLINPPDSAERITHYWNWEQHLMDKILPCLPTFSLKGYSANWENLNGYDFSEGIIQSWGKMDWDGIHTGQASTNEIVIADEPWTELNPIYQNEDDEASALITEARTDPLFYIDADKSVWPHLAKDYIYYNNTHVRFELREGVKWQTDPDGLFANEYFDAKDVYFSYYCYKNFGWHSYRFSFIDEIEIIDDYTIDIFLDNDPYTVYNDIDASKFPILCVPIVPEHYLNQSQEGDGVTPDTTHSSWAKYSDFGFGTGLFEIATYTEGVETQLIMNPDSWWLDVATTSDPDLDWSNRFGDFSSG
ncbi:MAG: hypothetical protein EAX90_12765, partial [Candidatus Heimdallarchaeota archaeon]|nr:hypothetical protein [Candidatus Heimdallarchaeota archaeon]